jgi:biopolymer transport protein ExbD
MLGCGSETEPAKTPTESSAAKTPDESGSGTELAKPTKDASANDDDQSNGSVAPLQLRLISNDDGTLKQIALNQQNFGNNEDSFRKLELEVEQIVKGGEKTRVLKRQVDIAADQRLRFKFVHEAISICAGHRDEKTKSWTSRFTNIRLITPDAALPGGVPRSFPVYVPLRKDTDANELLLPVIKVHLSANEDGTLRRLTLGQRNQGNDPEAFQRLNRGILNIIAGNPSLTKEMAVSIEGDAGLRYQHVMEAITACNGRLVAGRTDADNLWVVYIERFQFADIGDQSRENGTHELHKKPVEKPKSNPER